MPELKTFLGKWNAGNGPVVRTYMIGNLSRGMAFKGAYKQEGTEVMHIARCDILHMDGHGANSCIEVLVHESLLHLGNLIKILI